MKKQIYYITENIYPQTDERIFVRATENEVDERRYRGGFLRFNSEPYAECAEFPRAIEIDGIRVLSLTKFDKWLKEHKCK